MALDAGCLFTCGEGVTLRISASLWGLPADYWGKAARVHYWWTHGEASQLVLYKIAELVLLV